MPETVWPPDFEAVVRQHLPGLEQDRPMRPDDVLADLGLDSLRMVGLLVGLEDQFGITFPDELLVGDAFTTISTLWRTFQQVPGATAGVTEEAR